MQLLPIVGEDRQLAKTVLCEVVKTIGVDDVVISFIREYIHPGSNSSGGSQLPVADSHQDLSRKISMTLKRRLTDLVRSSGNLQYRLNLSLIHISRSSTGAILGQAAITSI